MNRSTIDTWRTVPRKAEDRQRSSETINFKIVPSGRRGIINAMEHFGLRRPDRIAIPEFSSHCVINCVATFATPLPMTEAISHNLESKCILIYEQWGWRQTETAIDRALGSAECCILDCVDTPDAMVTHQSLLKRSNTALVVSLNKCLGYPAGGLLQTAGLKHQQNRFEKSESDHTDKVLFELDYNLYKNHARSLAPLHPYLEKVDLISSLNDEAKDRSRNLNNIAASALSSSWSKAMREAIENGGSAGIAPVLKGAGTVKLNAASQMLREQLQIIAPVYNFNWSLDPYHPDYQPCLALPCHGEMNMQRLIADLDRVLFD